MTFNVPLIHQGNYEEAFDDSGDITVDTLILQQGGWMYTKPEYMANILSLIGKCSRLVYVQNDYMLGFPTQVKQKLNQRILIPEILVWSATAEYSDKLLRSSSYAYLQAKSLRYMNWNALSYRIEPIPLMNPVEMCDQRLMYYGTLRPDRMEYFERWLSGRDVVISAGSPRAAKKWEDFNNFAEVVGTLDSLEMLAGYARTVYIEDKYSHDSYTSPACRFYECVSAGVGIAFDDSVHKTFERAGIDIADYVFTPEQVGRWSAHDIEEVRKDQRHLWGRMPWRKEALLRLAELGEEIGLD